MRGRSPEQLHKDAVTIRGILDLMEREVEPVTIRLVQMTQHIGEDSAYRFMHLLEKAKVIEHPTGKRSWQLIERGRTEILDVEKIARGEKP